MSHSWYALYTKPHKERSVAERLRAEQLDVFCPSIRVKPVNPRARKWRPYFPGYLFVRIDLEEMGDNALRWTEGSHGLVSFGGQPASVPDQLIAMLKEQLKTLAQANQQPGHGFKRGDRVRVNTGPFEGYEAIFDTHLSGRQRVQILLTLLRDRPKRIQLDADQIEEIRQRN